MDIDERKAGKPAFLSEREPMQYDGAALSQLKTALNEFILSPNKSLGQNFLCDPNACDAIIRAAGDLQKQNVLEIGPGAGALTCRLCRTAAHVTAIEIDEGFYQLLHQKLSDHQNLTLIHGDALKVDLADAVGPMPCTVIANLPYYITTPLLFRCVEELPQAQKLVLMMQKEVAARLLAPKGKEMGAITIAIDYFMHVQPVLTLPPNCFYPRPSIDSSVLLFQRRPYPIACKDEEHLLRLVHQAFRMRRKTIWNNLSAFYAKDQLQAGLERAGIPQNARAEQLGTEGFIALSNALVSL